MHQKGGFRNNLDKSAVLYDQYQNNSRLIPVIPLNKIQTKEHIMIQNQNTKAYNNSFHDYQNQPGLNRFKNTHINSTGVKQKLN
jgi:hypothetical protein